MIYLICAVFVYLAHLILKLNWIMTGILGGMVLAVIPLHRRRRTKMIRQTNRFYDACLYMDTILYAFLKEGKVEAALADVTATLHNGSLKDIVQKAYEHMQMTFDETQVMEDALAMIEKEYACKRMKNIHAFLTHVEMYGGDIERPIRLLLEDKSRWEKRIRQAMQERKKMWIDIVLSVVVSLVICGIVLYLPVMNIDISTNMLSQILTMVVIVLDELILLKGQSYLAPDWLSMDEAEDDAYYEKKMTAYRKYDPAKEYALSFLLGAAALAGSIMAFWFWGRFAGAVGLLIMLVCLNQHRIGHSMAEKSLVRGIQCAFPGWLMDLALLLQSENVQVALSKSVLSVPGILRQDLSELLAKLEMDPEASEPYHAFLQEFHLPEVHSAMSMLFSLSIGNSNRSGEQVAELIDRNQQMMDTSLSLRMKDKNSGMYLLFLAPVLTASVKLVTDMAIFMLTFMSMATV